jgi:hypothetical protein
MKLRNAARPAKKVQLHKKLGKQARIAAATKPHKASDPKLKRLIVTVCEINSTSYKDAGAGDGLNNLSSY